MKIDKSLVFIAVAYFGIIMYKWLFEEHEHYTVEYLNNRGGIYEN